jgi:hypothetical protein
VTLEVAHFAKGRKVLSLTVCPACGYEFAKDEDRYHHLGEHDPDDFGLAPIGETNEAAQAPLFPETRGEGGADDRFGVDAPTDTVRAEGGEAG